MRSGAVVGVPVGSPPAGGDSRCARTKKKTLRFCRLNPRCLSFRAFSFFFENVSGSFHPLPDCFRSVSFSLSDDVVCVRRKNGGKKKNFTKNTFQERKKKSLLLFAPTAGLKESVKVGETVTKPKEMSDFTSCAGRRGQIKTLL